MKTLKYPIGILALYLVIVIAFECFVIYAGSNDAADGLAPDDEWIMITTYDETGRAYDTVLAGIEVAGQIHISTNHWPRNWYQRAVQNPEIMVTMQGSQANYLAIPLNEQEHAQALLEYPLPLALRILSGFPPRSFLRLEIKN